MHQQNGSTTGRTVHNHFSNLFERQASPESGPGLSSFFSLYIYVTSTSHPSLHKTAEPRANNSQSYTHLTGRELNGDGGCGDAHTFRPYCTN